MLILATAKKLVDNWEDSEGWGAVWKDELEFLGKSNVPFLEA